MKLESGYFRNRRGKNLFTVRIEPDSPKGTWIFCNPFIEEKNFSIDVYKHFAQCLARDGYQVIRFDYEGDGDSEGDLSTIGLSEWIDDVEDVYTHIIKDKLRSSLKLFGFRLGAQVCIEAASRLDADHVLVWDPLTEGESYFQDCLRYNLMTQLACFKKVVEDRNRLQERLNAGETVNILGFEVGSKMAQSLKNMNFLESCLRTPDSTRVDAVTFSEKKSNLLAQAFSEAGRSNTNHVNWTPIEAFWNEPKTFDSEQSRLIELSREMLAHV